MFLHFNRKKDTDLQRQNHEILRSSFSTKKADGVRSQLHAHLKYELNSRQRANTFALQTARFSIERMRTASALYDWKFYRASPFKVKQARFFCGDCILFAVQNCFANRQFATVLNTLITFMFPPNMFPVDFHLNIYSLRQSQQLA